MRYQGSCHCGAVQFAFDAEPITEGVRCNCSICRRRGAVMSKTYLEGVSVEGLDRLVAYQWGDLMMNHWFCPTCGIYPFADVIERPGIYRVNLGCLDGVDPLAVSVTLIDGAAF
ncbi:MAG: GFA family protein [Polyangiales bacterium]